MDLTLEEIISSRYKLQAAPIGSWRIYDENNPIPGYFEFDWLSSRHPDLYHKYALSTVGLMKKLHLLMDLTNCDVLDIGAGTGRSAIGVAEKAKRVFALDWFQSVVWFGNHQLQEAYITNVYYINGDRDHLPLPENSMDVVINAWAELNPEEAYRVLKPNGYLIQLGAVPNALCGELTTELSSEYPWLAQEGAPAEVFEPGYPDTYGTTDSSIWNGIPVIGSVHVQQFTYVADYREYSEIASMTGRLYGPKAKDYFVARKQATFSWRLQIIVGQVNKPAHRE